MEYLTAAAMEKVNRLEAAASDADPPVVTADPAAADMLAGRTPAQLAARIAAEVERLDACGMSSPFGGWRNEAVRHVADMLDVNPYTLDGFVRRGTEPVEPDPAAAFGPPQTVAELQAALRLLAAEVERINALGGALVPGEDDEGPGPDGWPSDEACRVAGLVLHDSPEAGRARLAALADGCEF